MNIYLSNGQQLRGDSINGWILRSDLAPVPRTLEFSVRLSDGLERALAEGRSVKSGVEMLEYQIIKAERKTAVGAVQGDTSLQLLQVTAVLKGCVGIASRSGRAIVIENGNVRQIYASAGANYQFSSDVSMERFSCLKGQVPSFAIAQMFQEQQIALVLTSQKGDPRISIARLKDLFKQDAKYTIGQTDSSEKVESTFLEDHDIPSFFSVDDTGDFVMGEMYAGSPVMYQPRSAENILRNMSHVLVRRRMIASRLAETVNAGDVIAIGKQKLLVSTAAHSMKRAEGSIEVASKFWCSELV